MINAEFAIIEELNKHSKIFKKIKDDYLKDRFDDVRDVCKRILENLQNKKKKQGKLRENQILVASELSPADLLSHSKSKISGLVSVLGRARRTFCNCCKIFIYSYDCWSKNFIKKYQK